MMSSAQCCHRVKQIRHVPPDERVRIVPVIRIVMKVQPLPRSALLAFSLFADGFGQLPSWGGQVLVVGVERDSEPRPHRQQCGDHEEVGGHFCIGTNPLAVS